MHLCEREAEKVQKHLELNVHELTRTKEQLKCIQKEVGRFKADNKCLRKQMVRQKTLTPYAWPYGITCTHSGRTATVQGDTTSA